MNRMLTWARLSALLAIAFFYVACSGDEEFGPYRSVEIFYFSPSGKLYAGTDGTGLYRLAESETEWISVGLKRLRIRDFAKLDTHYYVATTSGIFRSKYLDIPWKRIDRGLPSRTTTAYALERHKDRMYTGAANSGIYWIQDKGLAWARTAFQQGTAFSLKSYGDTLYAGTDRGFIRSDDDGATWTNTGLQGMGISAMEVVGTRLIVGTGQFIFPNRRVLLGDGIFYSDDNGTTWKQSESLRNVNILSIASVSGAVFCAGGVAPGVYRLFRSKDNGETWEEMFTGTVTLTPITLAYTGTRLYAGTPRTGIYYSDDGGNTWVEYSSGLPRS